MGRRRQGPCPRSRTALVRRSRSVPAEGPPRLGFLAGGEMGPRHSNCVLFGSSPPASFVRDVAREPDNLPLPPAFCDPAQPNARARGLEEVGPGSVSLTFELGDQRGNPFDRRASLFF